jgi:ribosomal protein L37E
MIDGVSVGGLLWRLRRRLVGPSTERFQFECRRCGRSIHEPHQHCPACGAADVARYEL